MTLSTTATSLSGRDLHELFSVASAHLAASANAIDAINVYPVPDGDTGSNMAATLAEALRRAAPADPEPTAESVLAALARDHPSTPRRSP